MQIRFALITTVTALGAIVAAGCGGSTDTAGTGLSDAADTSAGSSDAAGTSDTATVDDGRAVDDAGGEAAGTDATATADSSAAGGTDDAALPAPDADPASPDTASPDTAVAPAADAQDDAAAGSEDALVEPDTSAGEPDAAAPTAVATPVTLTAADGKQLAATEHRMSDVADGSPGVLLIHQFYGSQAQWDPYLPALLERGLIVVTLDLRGHGASDPANGDLPIILNDPGQAPLDVQAGLAQLTGPSGADAARIAVIGTSIGANLACVASANAYGVKLAVAASARDTAVASLAAKAVEDLTFTGLFILATENDSAGVQAATAQAFHDASTSPSDLLILEGSDHGKDIFANHPAAVDAVYEWLDTYL